MIKEWYLCDPSKNINCKKDMCYQNEKNKFEKCQATSNPDYAFKTFDGKPIKIKWINGEEVIDYD